MSRKHEGTGASRSPFGRVSFARLKQLGTRPSHKLLIVVAALLLVVLWQLVYPRDRALPLARLDGAVVSAKSTSELTTMVRDQYEDAPISVVLGDETYRTQARTVGLVPDGAATAQQLTAYNLWQRFVPFSLFVKGFFTDQPVITATEDTTFSAYVLTLQESCAVAVEPARLALRDDAVVVEPARDGQRCAADTIRQAFAGLGLRKDGVTVVVEPEVIGAPGKNVSTAESVKAAEELANQQLALSIDGVETAVAKETLLSWLTLPYDEKAAQYRVAVDERAVQAYVKTAEKTVYVAPGVTRIYNDKDGIEQGREAGSMGRGLDIVPVAKALSAAVLGGTGGTVEAQSITLMPTVLYDHPYTPDRQGLQHLLDDLVKNKGDFGIALRTTDGNLTVSSNGERRYPPASTYKMIVGWAILKRIDAGQLSWNDSAVLGLSVSECFDTMIIDSNNECAEYFGEKVIGWRNLNAMAQGLGMTCSDWNAGWYSCAQDEALFLQKLKAGELLNATQAERLLSVMRVQAFREGIPTGVNWTVEDKVGFLYGLLHDAALVSSPYGEYALVILTDNSSWAEIADAAWQIDAQFTRMNQ